MSASCPNPEAEKQHPNHIVSTTMLHSWYEVFLLKCFLWVAPTMSTVTVAKQLYC